MCHFWNFFYLYNYALFKKRNADIHQHNSKCFRLLCQRWWVLCFHSLKEAMSWLRGAHIHTGLDILIFLLQHLLTWQIICTALKCDSFLLQVDKWTFSKARELRDLQISPRRQCSDHQIGSPHAEIVSWPNYTQDAVSSLHLLPFSADWSTLILHSEGSFCGCFH